ncbi:MAG: CBS domain-containing protein [Hymenobacter sp.]
MRVREVMTEGAITVGAEERVLQAAQKIAGRHIGGVFVVEGDVVLGKVSRSDLLQAVFPSYEEFYDDLIHSIDFEQIQHRVRELAGLRVREVMQPAGVTVNPDMHVMKVAALMVVREIHRVPVVDSTGRFCGVVSRGDIFDRLIDAEFAAVRALTGRRHW